VLCPHLAALCSQAVVRWLAERLHCAAMVIYEQVRFLGASMATLLHVTVA
jgi:hypothetical protein